MTNFYCCEICWRNPTCGNDCGSCTPDDEERDPVNGQIVSAHVGSEPRMQPAQHDQHERRENGSK